MLCTMKEWITEMILQTVPIIWRTRFATSIAISPPSIFCTERGTQLKKQSVALSAGVFFQNHHRREPTAIIASLASMLLHIHNYIIQHSISFVKYFHTKSKIGYRSPTVRGSRFLYKSKCKTMRNDTWVVPYKAFHKIPI